jgi:DNA-directed RNA polymerase alpha subunit
MARRTGATTVRDLVLITEEELFATACFGETALREIRERLAERGLRLGMAASEVSDLPAFQGNIVAEGTPGPSRPAAEHPDEGACCGHCEEAARSLRERVKANADAERAQAERQRERKLNMSLPELELSLRVVNCLEAEGLATVRDLVVRTEEELLKLPNFGEASLRHVKTRLGKHGLDLHKLGGA